MMLVRNPVLNRAGGVDCEIDHPVFGWIPYSAYETDADGTIYAKASAMKPAPYVPPAEPPAADPRATMQMTFAQLLIGLVAMKWITKPEGVAWLDGTLPAAVSGLIATLPAADQFPALVRAKRPSVVQRLDGLVLALAALQGRSDEDMDAFFVTYAAV